MTRTALRVSQLGLSQELRPCLLQRPRGFYRPALEVGR
jgi:hypothetical protein